MSKRMKLGLSLAPSPSGSHADADAKTMHKHQILLQDYQELQMETYSIGEELDAIKQRKLILLAEVRFLRQRHKNLLEANYRTLLIQQQQQQNLKKIHPKSNPKLSRQPPIRKGKGVIVSSNNNKVEKASSSATQNQFYFAKLEERKGNNPTTMNLGSSKEGLISKNGSVFLGGERKDKAPFFDLNQISREELECQDEEEDRIEEMKQSVAMRSEGTNKHTGKLQLMMWRNMGNGNHGTSGGKRKISWQDPVALKV